MNRGGDRQDDPWRWCTAIALAFLALALHRLAIPSIAYFDETHYVAAARKLLELAPVNREHPLLAKQIIAASIAVLGDQPLAWRLPATLFGSAGLFWFGRLVWTMSGQRSATILAMLLLAANFMWFVQSRIAMLDIFAASLALLALWQLAKALSASRPRRHLALAGLAIGLALGAKWSVVSLAPIPGLWLLCRRLSGTDRGTALQRISLAEAAVWLGLMPLAVYWLTYLPAFFYPAHSGPLGPLSPLDFIAQHRAMIDLQAGVIEAHTYQSTWWQWIMNLRPVWYLYEPIDGAQRGIVLLGNPLVMLAGLPALAWCVWAGVTRARSDALMLAVLTVVTLAMWPLSGKPVQFYYHYLLPATFLTGCLALSLAEMLRGQQVARMIAGATLAASLAMFVYFYPILSAAELVDGRMAFAQWMWLDSWR